MKWKKNLERVSFRPPLQTSPNDKKKLPQIPLSDRDYFVWGRIADTKKLISKPEAIILISILFFVYRIQNDY